MYEQAHAAMQHDDIASGFQVRAADSLKGWCYSAHRSRPACCTNVSADAMEPFHFMISMLRSSNWNGWNLRNTKKKQIYWARSRLGQDLWGMHMSSAV